MLMDVVTIICLIESCQGLISVLFSEEQCLSLQLPQLFNLTEITALKHDTQQTCKFYISHTVKPAMRGHPLFQPSESQTMLQLVK